MPSTADASSVRRLRADPRCAIEIVRFEREAGILLHLGFRSRASVEPQDAPRFLRLLTRYLGNDSGRWNRWFVDHVARPDDPRGRIVRLAPDSIFTNSVSLLPRRSPPRLELTRTKKARLSAGHPVGAGGGA